MRVHACPCLLLGALVTPVWILTEHYFVNVPAWRNHCGLEQAEVFLSVVSFFSWKTWSKSMVIGLMPLTIHPLSPSVALTGCRFLVEHLMITVSRHS